MIFLIYFLVLIGLLLATRKNALRENDRALEYEVYCNGGDGLIKACLFVTEVPRLLTKLGMDKFRAFLIAPCFFYALMPAFVYLIARLYLDVWLSIITVLFLLSNFFFAYSPNTGRVGMGWGLFAGVVYGVLSGNIVLSVVCAFLLVVAHYGTVLYAIYLFGGTYVLLLITGSYSMGLMVVWVTLLLFFPWVHFYAKGAEVKCFEFMVQLFSKKPIKPNFKRRPGREKTVQAAFGKGFNGRNVPQKIEFFMSWIMAGILTIGVGSFILGAYPLLDRVLVGFAFSSVLLAIVVPHISVYYGLGRVYFTSLVVLAPCFVLVLGYWALPLILVYFLCVSGILHSWFGINKRRYNEADS